MELPKTLEDCHEIILELLEENATLRKAGADFGRLAERLNSALVEERGRMAAHRAQKPARSSRKVRWTAGEERADRWSVNGPAAQTCGPAAAGRHVRRAGPAPRPVPFKGFL